MKKTLVHELRVGDSLFIDDKKVVITLQSKSGQRARLSVTAEDQIQINRCDEQKDPEPAMMPQQR